MHRNTTNFPKEVSQFLQQLPKIDKSDGLRYHQRLTREYFIKSHSRGILIYHKMGAGKSRLAVSIAETIKKEEPNRHIVLLSTRSLRANFQDEIAKYLRQINPDMESDRIQQHITNNYNFVSSNASNMIEQLMTIKKPKDMQKLLELSKKGNEESPAKQEYKEKEQKVKDNSKIKGSTSAD